MHNVRLTPATRDGAGTRNARAAAVEKHDHRPAPLSDTTIQGEPLVQHDLSNTCVLQQLRIMQQFQLAVLDK